MHFCGNPFHDVVVNLLAAGPYIAMPVIIALAWLHKKFDGKKDK